MHPSGCLSSFQPAPLYFLCVSYLYFKTHLQVTIPSQLLYTCRTTGLWSLGRLTYCYDCSPTHHLSPPRCCCPWSVIRCLLPLALPTTPAQKCCNCCFHPNLLLTLPTLVAPSKARSCCLCYRPPLPFLVALPAACSCCTSLPHCCPPLSVNPCPPA
jgi:hypothetical protein